MAELVGESGRPPVRSLPEALVRSLRHELGDLLQKVYASVAILKDRLPPERELERGVLTRLWSRADACRRMVDTAHDFVCRVTLDCQPLDLARLAEGTAAAARERFPNVAVVTETLGSTVVTVDARRLTQVGELLLTNACEAAKSCVRVRTQVDPSAGEVGWVITDDGPGINPELTGELFTPFFTTRAGHTGLGLALARKLVELHGGRITAGNLPGGGFQVQVRLPVDPPESEQA